jgi:hypothetical protein
MPVAKEQDEIFRAALSLPEEIRAVLAERLWESLDSAGQREIDARWGKEAEDRIDAYEIVARSLHLRPCGAGCASLPMRAVVEASSLAFLTLPYLTSPAQPPPAQKSDPRATQCVYGRGHGGFRHRRD